MRKLPDFHLAFLGVFFAASCLISNDRLHGEIPEGYQFIWGDEFDGTELDESAWWYRTDVKQQSVQLVENV